MKRILLAVVIFFALISMSFAAVNLNMASKDELDGVKGIGPVKAQAIIDYRQKNGPFKSVDDLKNVNGFGDKTVAKMRSELTVSGGGSAKKADKAVDNKEGKSAKADKQEKKEVEKKSAESKDKKDKAEKK